MPSFPFAGRLGTVALAAALAACTSDATATPDASAIGAPAGPPPAVAVVVSPADSVAALDARTAAAYARIVAAADSAGIADRPYGEIVQWVGEQLQGRPYVAGLLDAPPRETLVADLTRFDCVLYIENVLAVAHTIATGETTADAYIAEIARMRYRGGQMNGYASRLHYFSEWIADNAARGILQNVTVAAGGEPFDKRITFMSEHRSAYPHLADDSTFALVRDAEAALAGLDLVYIPKARIAEAYAHLQPGDVIATATSIAGLDVTHTGFVHVAGRQTGFMHASSASNAVKVSPDLHAYVRDIRSQVGIIIARPLDPRLAPAAPRRPTPRRAAGG
jgi:hypothetical protein